MTTEKWSAEGHSTDRKMDLPRALTIMGFKTTMAFEGQTYEQRKFNLDKNHSKRMHEIQEYKVETQLRERKESRSLNRSKSSVKRRKNKRHGAPRSAGGGNTEGRNPDKFDIQVLQEAYQFLLKKYCTPKKKKDKADDDDSKFEEIGIMMF